MEEIRVFWLKRYLMLRVSAVEMTIKICSQIFHGNGMKGHV